MWLKLAIGAVVGLVVGHFVPPGYALWVILGIVVGYLVELWVTKDKTEQKGAG